MIVVSRKKNETIVINSDITITVVEIRGDKVRLGIVSPREVPVHRQEVFEAIHGIGLYQPTCNPQPPGQPVSVIEISVNQLVHELGATDSEVDRKARFTNEGGIPH